MSEVSRYDIIGDVHGRFFRLEAFDGATRIREAGGRPSKYETRYPL